ncbi:PucR family transcriptional regulator ligand-binding domain-containing protein [Pseudomonas sp. CDFA 602]|uniref:PucR family transcriptional regulator n=1 Tax=Pseudomonas californiensis TaxID=2829823 RepID=UPI001E47368D|nr:PucR family transcriptional regulator [Pseudomonas californiensis]MCD5995762.1 PucR family transcriptional regulator ligand-binding domain-containing protein [Pseudomonas californiensis]MCD6001385.1 PucR family transcriptional regulator ligand-binding domain-containing protein [Pseudomonas californiensis]
MSLTVEEILQLAGLEEMTVRAGARNLHRSVRWSYVAENEGIAEWVMGGELVFITGINHAREEANLLSLVSDGDACGIAGLVILTGGAFIQHIPQAVVELAEQLGLPLIEQPYLLKMVIVTHLIGTALVQMAHTRRSRHDIIGQLLTGDYPSLATTRQRAALLQLPVDQPRCAVALRMSQVGVLFDRHSAAEAERLLQLTRQRVQDQLDAWCQNFPAPLPVIAQGDLFVLLLPDLSALRIELAQLHRSLRALTGDLSVFMGLSQPVQDCGHYRRALNEARQALEVAENLRPATGLCDFSELGVLRLLQGIGDRSIIDAFVSQTLTPMVETGRKRPHTLIETLDALLRENGNAIKAAQRLNIHRNTLNQRIQRIEQQSRQSLDDPLFRMNASVALLIWRMTEAQGKE